MPIPSIPKKRALQAETEEKAAAEEAAAAREQASADEDSSSGQSEDEGQPGSHLKVPCYPPRKPFTHTAYVGTHLMSWLLHGKHQEIRRLDPVQHACLQVLGHILFPATAVRKTWCLHDRLKTAKTQRR